MNQVLVFVEHQEGMPLETSLQATTLAGTLGDVSLVERWRMSYRRRWLDTSRWGTRCCPTTPRRQSPTSLVQLIGAESPSAVFQRPGPSGATR